MIYNLGMLMPLFLAVALPLGFLAPGYLLARLLASRAPWASTFVLSQLVLFHAVFWIGAFGLPVRFATVAAGLGAVTAITALAALRWGQPAPATTLAPGKKPVVLAVAAAGLIGVFLALRCTLAPLTGYDTYWRWDFLAQQLLRLERFDFYPPVAPEQYSVYFYAEAIPPLVSFSYWWLYAAAGEHLPGLTALLVVAQYAATMIFVYKTGTVLFSPRAGAFAVVALTSSSLYYWSIAMGQETGLTALSAAAMTYFLVCSGERTDLRGMILAGLCAAVAPLAREYGWAFVACGVVILWWLGRGPKAMLIFALTAVAVAAPWYVRTWWLTGNPLYSNRLLGLPVNPVHAAIMDSYREGLGVSQWSAAQWRDLGQYLLSRAPVPLLLGPAAVLALWRRRLDLVVFAAVLVGLWLTSIGYTSGGPRYACRVLSPALVVLSLLVGGLLDRVRRRGALVIVSLVLLICYGRAAVYGLLYPSTSVTPSDWPRLALQRQAPSRVEEQFAEKLPEFLPHGSRILCENTYAHAALAGHGYDIVPVWSPEVRFLFDPGAGTRAVQEELWRIGFRAVMYDRKSAVMRYLDRFPIFAEGPAAWRVLAEVENPGDRVFVLYELPPPAP